MPEDGQELSQNLWGFLGLDCINLPGSEERNPRSLWSVLNMEWDGNTLHSRWGLSPGLYTWSGNTKVASLVSGGATVTQIYQLRLSNTSNYDLAVAGNKLYRIEFSAGGNKVATELHTLLSTPDRSPAFTEFKDMAILCTDNDIPHFYDPIAGTPVDDLITSYPSGYTSSSFFPDVVCSQQSRLFMAIDKTVFCGPYNLYADWNTTAAADDAASIPIDCRGRIIALIPWHEAEVVILTDYGERKRLILGEADATAFYIKDLPEGKGAVKDTAQSIGDTVLFSDRAGTHNLTQEQFVGDLRALEASQAIRSIFSGGRLSNTPFRLHGTYSTSWRSVNFHAKSQYWLAVNSGARTENNWVIVFHYDQDPMKISIFQFSQDKKRINFNSGSSAIVVDETLTGASSGATGVVESIDEHNGTWAGTDQTGQIIVNTLSDTDFTDGENLNGSTAGANCATVSSHERIPLPISALASVLDSEDKERILIGSTEGRVFSYGLEYQSDADVAYNKKCSFLIHLGDISLIKVLRYVILNIIETGNWDLTVNVYSDFDKSSSESQTVSCVKDSAYLGSFTLNTDSLGRRELFSQIERFNSLARVFEIEISNADKNTHFSVQGVDCYGHYKRRLAGTP